MSFYNATCRNSRCTVYIAYYAETYETVPRFCPECGTEVIERCPNCKVALPNWEIWVRGNPSFCANCGEQLRFDPDEQESAAPGA